MSAMDFIADLFRGWEKGDSAPFFAALAEAATFLCSPRRTHRWLPARARLPSPLRRQGALGRNLGVVINQNPSTIESAGAGKVLTLELQITRQKTISNCSRPH
jgi:hypothetical protein